MSAASQLAKLGLAVLLLAPALPAVAMPVSAGLAGAADAAAAAGERPAAPVAGDAASGPSAEPRRPSPAASELEAQTRVVDVEAAFAKSRRQEIEAQAVDLHNRTQDADPLRGVVRSLVNVTTSPAAAPTAQPSPAPEASRPDGSTIDRGETLTVDLDENLRAAMLDVKGSVADVVRGALNPRVDESGRVSFSVAGIDGIHLASNGREIAFGIGDTQLGSASIAPPPEAVTTRRAAQDMTEANLIRRAINTVYAIVEHPLTWMLLGCFMLGWFVIAVSSAQTRKSS